MDNKKLTYFVLFFSLVILLIGVALIIVGSIALKDSKNQNCINGDKTTTEVYNNYSGTTNKILSTVTVPQNEELINYFIQINMKLNDSNNIINLGNEIILKVRKALLNDYEPNSLSVISIDNDYNYLTDERYNIIILISYLHNAPTLDVVSNMLTLNGINVLKHMNLTNNYIPQIKGDETCTTFCTINCPCTTNVLPTTTKSGDMSSTTNSGDITSTTNSEGMTSTTNFTSVTSTTNSGSMTSTTNSISISSTTNSGSIVSTTNSGSMTSTTNSISISSTTNSGSIVSTTNSGSTTLTTKYSNMTSTTNSGTITTSTACPLSSCNTLIAVDSSSDILIPYLFEKELEIIQNNISKVIPDFSRVAIASYNEKTTINSYFNTLSNSINFSNIIGSITSKPGSRLSILLETLYNITIPENTIINTVIFISEYIPDEISNSVNISKLIKERGSLNFIILGTDIKEEYLKILEPTNVFQLDFSICDINEVNDKFKNFTSCQSCSSPSLTTTIFSESYEPCKSSITFSILGSNDIPTSAFNVQIQALMNNNIIPSSWNHYERISIMEYDDSANIKANFNYLESRENFNSILNSLQQEDSGINLANLFAALETGLIFYPNDIAENHFIFVYNITQNDIQKAFPFSQKLKNNGSLNIIVLGTNYISGLNNLTNGARILYWDYTTKNNDILLKSFINDNLVCVLAQKKFL